VLHKNHKIFDINLNFILERSNLMSIFNHKLSNTLAVIMFGTALTFTGCGSDDDDDSTPAQVDSNDSAQVVTKAQQGILLRRGTSASISNTIIVGDRGKSCLEMRDEATLNSNPQFTNVVLGGGCSSHFGGNDGVEAEGVQNQFNANANNSVSEEANATKIAKSYEGEGYIGAFDPNAEGKWTDGWTHEFIQPSFVETAEEKTAFKFVAAEDIEKVSGNITEDTTWTKDKIWQLDGEVNVVAPATLTIEAGTVVAGAKGPDYLAINAGAKIHAEGTAEAPIIFTSFKDISGSGASAGNWGGLTVLGNAQTNKGESTYEAGSQTFGSDSASGNSESSGVLKYVQIKYTGYAVEADKELNGLSLAGVGSGTVIDHVEVYVGADDGVELWGGTANLSHVAIIGAGDDSLDWTDGWTGTADHIYIHQTDNLTSDDPRGIEADSNGDDNDAEPRSNPTISQMTIVADEIK
jgi:hypothetical protein